MLTLQIERRLAPFWRGLNDHSDSWTEHQLVAAARGLPIPAADEVPESPQSPRGIEQISRDGSDQNNLTVPILGRALSSNSDSSQNLSPSQQQFSLPNATSPSSGSALLRGRAKTLASLTTSSKNASQAEMQPREIYLSHDPCVNGQPTEAYLYKDASECPICFLYYPPYLNRTRCCDQPICSECFVQIRRPDPHPPEHGDSSEQQPSADSPAENPEGVLVSEPAACPYCVQPEFGITYDPLPIRRGLAYANQAPSATIDKSTPPMSSSSSLASLPQSGQLSPQPRTRKRGTSLSAASPQVITTDRVRPDWANKLAGARAHAARRSAAATALHTAAYLMGGRNGSSAERSFSGFGRRAVLRRGTGSDSPSSGSGQGQLNMLSMMSEHYGPAGQEGQESNPRSPDQGEPSPSIVGPPRQSSRRNRVEDLEEMMMMEAIRLSLASEEDRLKREEKEAKKDAKKKEKEDKKAEKAARKAGFGAMYTSSTNQSSSALGSPSSASLSVDPSTSKGKGIARDAYASSDSLGPKDSQSESAQLHLEKSRAQILPSDQGQPSPLGQPSTYRPSHLRNLSNASSSASSIADVSATLAAGCSTDDSPDSSGFMIAHAGDGQQESSVSATPPGGGAGTEPMFNFRSLTEMISRDEKDSGERFVEHADAERSITAASTVPEEGETPVAKRSESSEAERAPEAMNGVLIEDTNVKAPESSQSTATIKPDNSDQALVAAAGAVGSGVESDSASTSENGNISKAHEMAIETAGEGREQGSV